jgi:hypothetical protein
MKQEGANTKEINDENADIQALHEEQKRLVHDYHRAKRDHSQSEQSLAAEKKLI